MSQHQKYYHNDYKKLMGLDETRTASEKLLDRAVGGFKQADQIIQERPLQKKVKEEHTVLTHREILQKIIRNVDANFNAVKVLKPLNILKKCMNDQSFVSDAQINVFQQWFALASKLFQVDDKLVGNFSEVSLVIECLVQLFELLLVSLRKFLNDGIQVKQQLKQQKQPEKQEFGEQFSNKVSDLIETCEMHLSYCKMYTDDSFTFNKILGEFKKRFYGYYELKLTTHQPVGKNIYAFLEKLLIKMFHLPHTKYQWIRQSLSQFFKEFNIQFKHLLSEDQTPKYLKMYNDFINQRSSIKPQIDQVNIFGNGGKGGKVTSLEMASSDGLDKWTSKQ